MESSLVQSSSVPPECFRLFATLASHLPTYLYQLSLMTFRFFGQVCEVSLPCVRGFYLPCRPIYQT